LSAFKNEKHVLGVKNRAMEVEATPLEMPEKKKRAPRPYKKVIVIPYTEDNLDMLNNIDWSCDESEDDNAIIKGFTFQVREALLKDTEKEKREKGAAYRRDYQKRPNVRSKLMAKAKNPEIIAKNRAYSQLPATKERKKELSKRNRAIRKLLKQEKPEIYESLLEKVVQQYPPIPPSQFLELASTIASEQ
jgi:hypothetical protein